MEYILQPKSKISRKMAVEKICAFARFGNHSVTPRPTTNREVGAFLVQRNVSTTEFIERMRNPNEHIPFFENLIGSTWNISGGSQISVVNRAGEEEASVTGPGQVSMNNCQALFETAIKARDRAIGEKNLYHIYECLAFGISSIEAFFDTASTNWNRDNPAQLLIDDQNNKVSLETKILEWLPIISDGGSFDRSNRQWSDFKKLKRIRDNHAIHPKGGQGMSLKEMANHLNAFRYGIAHLLGNLHLIIHWAVPAVIINAIYFPDVEVVEARDES